jgi:hypothetical protein
VKIAQYPKACGVHCRLQWDSEISLWRNLPFPYLDAFTTFLKKKSSKLLATDRATTVRRWRVRHHGKRHYHERPERLGSRDIINGSVLSNFNTSKQFRLLLKFYGARQRALINNLATSPGDCRQSRPSMGKIESVKDPERFARMLGACVMTATSWSFPVDILCPSQQFFANRFYWGSIESVKLEPK